MSGKADLPGADLPKSDLLDRIAATAGHAAEQVRLHVAAEIDGSVAELMNTLTPAGPYAYTILPEVRADGSVRLPVLTTRDDIRNAYAAICEMRDLLSVSVLSEVRGEWYTFQDSISRTRRRSTGELGGSQTVALFPCGQGSGITGELVWVRQPREALGRPGGARTAPASDMLIREEVFLLHEAYVAALGRGDVDGVLDTLNDGVASAVRDYVDDTGTLMTIEGKEAHRRYYDALFDKFEVLSVEPFDRIAEDWYVFAELRMTVRRRDAGGQVLTFNTAEFFAPANDGRFIARVGHGTDPVVRGG